MYTLKLKKGEEKRIINGHPWVYANEVLNIEGNDTQGSIAKVISFDNKFIGYGFINHLSKIIVRILTRDDTPIDRNLFFNRIKNAKDSKEALGYHNNFRVVFGESDLLPGLIVDKYDDYLCVQILSLGMDKRKSEIISILIDLFQPKGIYERSDVSVRAKEGLPEFKSVIYGEVPDIVTIEENGILLNIDIAQGQKTGYFLDQKENRANLQYYVKNKEVLDCFSNVGGFSLCAAKYGATSVTSIDISEKAVCQINENAKINNLDHVIQTECCDVFEKLRDYKSQGRTFDTIILDPPAFTKSKDTVKDALKGYRDINILALKLLNKGGYLITCSCSQHLTLNLFMNMIRESANYSKVTAKLIELRTQSRDHASLLATDESMYLKVAVLQIL